MKNLSIDMECYDSLEPRIGGGALIGGVLPWPATSNGKELCLVASFPKKFVGIDGDEYVSIFSYYSESDYLLDRLTYHGSPEEMAIIEAGKTTQVIFHKKGSEIFGSKIIPARKLIVGGDVALPYQGSGIGAPAGLLQNEPLALQGFDFVFQLYSGDFPDGWKDIFGLVDAVAYLFIDKAKREGRFFVQVT